MAAIGGYPHDRLGHLVMVFGIADVEHRGNHAKSVDVVGAHMDFLALGDAEIDDVAFAGGKEVQRHRAADFHRLREREQAASDRAQRMAGEEALYFGVVMFAPNGFDQALGAVEGDRVVGETAIVIVMDEDYVGGQRSRGELVNAERRASGTRRRPAYWLKPMLRPSSPERVWDHCAGRSLQKRPGAPPR